MAKIDYLIVEEEDYLENYELGDDKIVGMRTGHIDSQTDIRHTIIPEELRRIPTNKYEEFLNNGVAIFTLIKTVTVKIEKVSESNH